MTVIHYIQLRTKLFKEVKAILYENYMVLNLGKCHYLTINKGKESTELGQKTLHAEAEQKFLGIIINKDLNFQSRRKSNIK